MADMTVRQPLALKYENITVGSTAVGLTASKYRYESTTSISMKNAEVALITVEGDQIRWTCDGTAPLNTSTLDGHRANVDDVIRLEGYDAIRLFKAIRLTTDAVLKVSYFGG